MKKVYLHGAIGKRFGRKWDLDAHSVPELLTAIECNSGEFFKYIYEKHKKGVEYIFLNKSPYSIRDEKSLVESVLNKEYLNVNYSDKEVHIVPLAQGGGLITALATTVFKFAGAKLATFLATMTVMTAVSFAINAIFKPPEPPKPGKQISTKSFLLSGGRNRQAQAIPVPVGYGRLKIGSANIDTKETTLPLTSNTESDLALESFTNIEYMDVLSEGPIQGFVNANGGPISGGDISEGIFLNDVQIKNTKSLNSENDTFNYVLNEEGDKPQVKLGEENETKILSNEVSFIKPYDVLLFGASPYASDEKISAYDSREDAENAGAKVFSHCVTNTNVNKVIISLVAELSQAKIDGGTVHNSCRFGIAISRDGKRRNIFDVNSGVTKLSFVRAGESAKTSLDIGERILDIELENAERSAQKEAFNVVKDVYISARRKLSAQGRSRRSPWTTRGNANKYLKKLTAEEQEVYNEWVNSEFTTSTNEELYVYGSTNVEQTNKIIQETAGLIDDSRGFFIINGIATSAYKFDIELEFDPSVNFDSYSGGVVISVVKLSSEYDPAVKSNIAHDGDSKFQELVGGLSKQRNLRVASVQERIPVDMLYPHTSMCKIKFDSKNFKQVPNRSYHLKLKKVLVPDNYDPVSRKYSGPWNGFFKGQEEGESINLISDNNRYWSDNPAWIFFDLVQNPRFGLGKYGLEEFNIDKWQLYKAAKYCDELVETRYPVETKTASLRGFKASYPNGSQQNDTEGNETENSFIINIDPDNKSWFVDVDGNEAHYDAYSENDFEREFGHGDKFKGKKIAIFINQHGHGGSLSSFQRSNALKNSMLRKGKYNIEERIIISSDKVAKTITVSGPTLEDDPATVTESGGNVVYGGCCTQISYPIVEPRFSCNIYLTDFADAISAMNNIAAIFRGMIGYSFGKILTMQDSKKSPIMLFNNSNIDRSQGFRYSGVDKNKKFTSALIRFNNKDKSFAPDTVYEEDPDSMRIYGHQEKEIMGLGITSESQARRLAKWVLFTSQLEVEKLTFTTGEEGSYLFPGSIIEVSDENRAGRNMSGRVIDVSSFSDGEPYIMIDKSAQDILSVKKVEITVNVGLPFVTDEVINNRAKFHKSSEDQDVEIDSMVTAQMIKFQGTLSHESSLEKFGPQGQKSIVSNLMVKLPFDVDISTNTFKCFNHGFVDGDRVRFTSDGVLPTGLEAGRVSNSAYFIKESTKNTFKVSKSSGDAAEVVLFDVGKDLFANEGGIHYVSPEETNSGTTSSVTENYINQIEIGAGYSLQGIYGTKASLVSEDSPLSRFFIVGEGRDRWYTSTMFGTIFLYGNNWAFSLTLGNIYLGDMDFDRATSDDYFWFYWEEFGWIASTGNLHNSYWYSAKDEAWMYIFYKPNGEINHFFLFKNDINTGNTYAGAKITLGDDKQFKVLQINAGVGLHVVPWSLRDSYVSSALIEPNQPSDTISQQEQQSNPAYRSANILQIDHVSPEVSRQNSAAIRITLDSGHNLDLYKNREIEIYGFNSSDEGDLDNLMNKKWNTIQINDNVLELIISDSDESRAVNDIEGATILNNGIIQYIESIESQVLRNFQSQLFRVVNIKEVEDRKYEIGALEYNVSKFDSIDKELSVRVPSVPIPPQADMDLPDAPEGLQLFDLTN